MKLFTKKEKICTNDLIDAEIMENLDAMKNLDLGSDEYAKLMYNVDKLDRLKQYKKTVSPDTLAVIGGNILIAMMIIKHEELHAVTSKAMGLLIKGRV